MKRRTQFYALALLILLCLSDRSLAQSQIIKNDTGDSLTVTASVANHQVRFTATSVLQMRLEVYNPSGKKLFDNELRGGNVLDWHLLDGQAQPLADDTYLCVITVKSLSGRITQRLGSVIIEQQTAKLQALAPSQMTAQQLEAIGPVEENAFLTPLEADQQPTTTVMAHDGEDGQITRGKGALTFRLGDFYSGKDTEQMRLTAEGNLGIGTNSPQARLDVAGTIRASGGILFPDGSVQYSASSKTLGAKSTKPGQKATNGQDLVEPNAAGTGIQNRIAKWADNAGTLGDSNIYELNGSIGINTIPDPQFRLDVLGHNRFRGTNPSFYLTGFKPSGNEWVFQTVDDNGRFRIFGQDHSTGAERLTILLDNGNVGIGIGTPTAKLDVAGTINTSVQYNIGGRQVLSVAGASNLFAGVHAGATNSLGYNNSFVGESAGESNTTGFNNTLVGESAGLSNTEGFLNTFVGESAGQQNTTGSENTFVGTFAGLTNKTGNKNTFIGKRAGDSNTFGVSNTFVGESAGEANKIGVNNTIIGSNANVSQDNLFFATAIGANAVVSDSNSIVLGRANGSDAVRIPGAVLIDGSLVVHTLGSAGSTQLCLNAADRLAPCSSSLRYKTNVQSFLGGLDIVGRLRPITFNWKDGGMADVGFGAEEVEKIEPRLTIRNRKGEIEGVKYAQLTTVLVNAVNEQQAQIEQYRKQFVTQQSELTALKQLLCRKNRQAAVCQSAKHLKR